MAGSPKVKITIAGDSKGAEQAASRTAGAFGKMGSAIKSHAGAIAAAVSVGAIAKFGESSVKTFENVVGQVRGLMRVTGDSATSMSQLRFAAKETGVDTDTLAKSLRLASKQVVASKSAFVANGIAVKDAHGKYRDMNAILGDTAAKFKSMPNGPQKTALAMKLFGKAGADMIPLLNQGKDGLLKFEGEAAKFGEVIGDKQVAMVKKNVEAHRRMHAAWEGFQIQLGARIFPVVAAVTSWFAQRLPGALDVVSRVIGRVIKDIGSVLNFLIGGWQGAEDKGNGFLDVIERIGEKARAVFDALKGGIKAFIAAWVAFDGDITSSGFAGFMEEAAFKIRSAYETLLVVFRKVGEWMMANKPTVIAFAAAIGALLIIHEVVGAVMALNLALAANPFVLAAVALAALVAGVVYAYTHFQRFRDIVDAVARFLRDKVLPAIQATMRGITAAAQTVVTWFQTHWDSIAAQTARVFSDVANVVRVYIGIVRTVIQVQVGIILAIWHTFHSQIMSVVSTTWNLIKGQVMAAMQVIRGVIKVVTALIHGDWGKAWNGIKQIFAGVWNGMKAQLAASLGYMKALISGAWAAVKALTAAAWAAIKASVALQIRLIVAVIAALPRLAVSALSSLGSGLVKVAAAAMTAMGRAISSGITAAVSSLAALPRKAVSAVGDLGHVLFQKGVDLIMGLARGAASAVGHAAASIAASVANAIPGAGIAKKVWGGLPFGASGFSNFPGGLAVVGEKGPELVNLPKGSDVIPNNRTKGFLSSPGGLSGGGGHVNVFNINVDARNSIGVDGTSVGKQIAAVLNKAAVNGVKLNANVVKAA